MVVKHVKMGELFNDTDQTLKLDDLILTSTLYAYSSISGHYITKLFIERIGAVQDASFRDVAKYLNVSRGEY